MMQVTIDPELLELMPHVITIERRADPAIDQFGQPLYDGKPFNLRCRIEGRNREVMSAAGVERVSSIQIYLPTTPGLTSQDKVTLPAPWEPRIPEIISIERQSDERGAYYEAIFA